MEKLTKTVKIGHEARRSYGDEYKKSILGSALSKMAGQLSADYAQAIARAFYNIYKQDTGRLVEILQAFLKNPEQYYHDQPVHWFWTEFYKTIRDKHLDPACRGTDFAIRIKACRDYYFYVLEGAVDGNEGGRSGGTGNKTKWKLLHDPFFRKAQPPGGHGSTKHPENFAEDVRGIADTLLFLGPAFTAAEKPQVEEITNALSWFDLRLGLQVKNWNNDNQELVLAVSPELRKTKHINLPPHQEPVLISSPAVRDAIRGLADVWINTKANTVLLSGAPGSGKDVLEKFLVSALRLDEGQVIEVSAAELQKFDNLRDTIENHLKQLDKESNEGGPRFLLFLDEIHHAAALDLRSGLLRMMEAGNLTARDGHKISCKNILYVLAASKPVQELMRTIPPPDLWTRMEHTVVLRHPLRLESTDESRSKVIQDYFFMFWTGRCKEEDLYYPQVNKGPSTELVENEKLVDYLATRFAREVGSPLIPLVSIRVIRGIVKRLKSRVGFYIRRHPAFTEVDQVKKGIEDEKYFDEWLYAIFNELVPDLDHIGIF